MDIHIRNDVFTVRVYEDGKSYENRDEYCGIATGYRLSDDEVFLTAAHGSAGITTIKKIFSELKKIGFKVVVMERNGKLKRQNIYGARNLA